MTFYESFPVLAEWKFDFRMDQQGWLFLLSLIILCMTATVLGVTVAIAGVVRRRAELELKRDLAERGMTADEIEKIIVCQPLLGRKNIDSQVGDSHLFDYQRR